MSLNRGVLAGLALLAAITVSACTENANSSPSTVSPSPSPTSSSTSSVAEDPPVAQLKPVQEWSDNSHTLIAYFQELWRFKALPAFHSRGFAVSGAYNEWLIRVQTLRDNSDVETYLDIGLLPADLINLAFTYLQNDGRIPSGETYDREIETAFLKAVKALGASKKPSSTIVSEPQTSPSAPSVYVVESGDTAAAIARRHEITLEKLLALNPAISNPNLLSVGQTLVVSEGAVQKTQTRDSRSTPTTSSTSARPSLTTFDRQCFEWGERTGESAGLTEREIQDDYAYWVDNVVAACRTLATGSRETCQGMKEFGLDPQNRIDVELVLALADQLGVAPTEHYIVAMDIWC